MEVMKSCKRVPYTKKSLTILKLMNACWFSFQPLTRVRFKEQGPLILEWVSPRESVVLSSTSPSPEVRIDSRFCSCN